MSSKDPKYRQDLGQQLNSLLGKMYEKGKGESRHDLKESDPDKLKGIITSQQTFETYKREGKSFVTYVRAEHPDCTSLKHAREYVGEYLQKGIDAGTSPWTLKTERSALDKIFGIDKNSHDFVVLPKREIGMEHNSRTDTEYSKHFSETNNKELVDFCKGTGARESALKKLTGDKLYSRQDVEKAVSKLEGIQNPTKEDGKRLTAFKEALATFPDKEKFILFEGDKHNRTRCAPIVGEHVDKIVERMEKAGDGKVFQHVPRACPEQRYRADYCRTVYEEYARDIDKIPREYGRQSPEIYYCRGTNAGRRLDKFALEKASVSCGHERLSVSAESYIRAL